MYGSRGIPTFSRLKKELKKHITIYGIPNCVRSLLPTF